MRRRGLALILLLASGNIVACGDEDGDADDARPGDQRAEVVEAVKDFQTSGTDRDAGAYCRSLTGTMKRVTTARFAPLGAKSCEEAAARAFKLIGEDEFARIKRSRDQLDTGDVRLAGNRAIVSLPVIDRPMELLRVGEDWYVSKLQ